MLLFQHAVLIVDDAVVQSNVWQFQLHDVTPGSVTGCYWVACCKVTHILHVNAVRH